MITCKMKKKSNTIGNKERRFKAGDIVQHFRGNIYRVITIATNTETGKLEVIYESLSGDRSVWARPYDMFESKVDREKYPDIMQEYRFEIVEIQNMLEEKSCANIDKAIEKLLKIEQVLRG